MKDTAHPDAVTCRDCREWRDRCKAAEDKCIALANRLNAAERLAEAWKQQVKAATKGAGSGGRSR